MIPNIRPVIRELFARTGMDHIDRPSDLFAHVAFNLKDHDEFRRVLDKTPIERRRQAYEILKPHLSFEARPLGVYLAENADEAERRQLPTIGADGSLIPFRTTVVESPEFRLQQAISAAVHKHHLQMTCAKCSKQEQFHGGRQIDAVEAARAAGWKYDAVAIAEICAACPGGI